MSDESSPENTPEPLIIDPGQLKPETLEAVIESYALREGTDYGQHEVELADKVAQLKKQLANGDISLVFDTASESVTLMSKAQLARL